MPNQIFEFSKIALLNQLIARIQQDLNTAEEAAQAAHEGATHEQSKAETQYDTLGLENAYLAAGQSKRIEELKMDIQELENLVANIDQENKKREELDRGSEQDKIQEIVQVGSCLEIESESQEIKWLLIVPAGGGYQLKLDNGNLKEASIRINTITPSAPLASVWIGKELDDEAEITLGSKKQYWTLINLF